MLSMDKVLPSIFLTQEKRKESIEFNLITRLFIWLSDDRILSFVSKKNILVYEIDTLYRSLHSLVILKFEMCHNDGDEWKDTFIELRKCQELKTRRMFKVFPPLQGSFLVRRTYGRIRRQNFYYLSFLTYYNKT